MRRGHAAGVLEDLPHDQCLLAAIAEHRTGHAGPLTLEQGTYHYVAKWPDGLEKRGRFVIDDLVTEAIEEGQATLTLDIR